MPKKAIDSDLENRAFGTVPKARHGKRWVDNVKWKIPMSLFLLGILLVAGWMGYMLYTAS